MAVTPTLTPDELLKAAESVHSIEELERIGNECFAPYAEAIANGTNTQGYIKNLPGKQGYTAIFQQLNEKGLEKGRNSWDGKHHIFQDCNYCACYPQTKEKDSATTKHQTASGVVRTADYMAVTSRLLQSSDASELAVGIAAATGRRSIEVVFIGKFTQAKAAPELYEGMDSQYLYQFQNPAKKRN